MKSENGAHDLEFCNTIGGGRSESKLLPLKSPVKWMKNCSTLTPSLITAIRSTYSLLTPDNNPSQTSGCACNDPARKSSGFLKRRLRKTPRAGSLATMAGEAKGPTKGWVPLKISHQDGSTVPWTATASYNCFRKTT